MYHWIVFGKGILAFLLLVHLLYERKVITTHDTANPPLGQDTRIVGISRFI